ncbi:unnamed protein product [Fusarium fujikuroi]|nr:hypothetical protein CEK25_005320 [Fusarium fujikuroi]VZH91888.1 unnamed protein product [Fusarium fujikuroi]
MASAQRTMIRQTLVGSYFNKERLQRCLERPKMRDGKWSFLVPRMVTEVRLNAAFISDSTNHFMAG